MMKKEGLPGIGVAQIGPADGRGYVTDHFLVTDRRWSAPALFAEPVRFYGACTGICTAGSCTISLNLKISEIRPGDLIFIVPGTIVHIPRQSDDFSLCMTGFSAEFLKGIYQAINPLYPYIFQTPVLPLAADDAETLLDLFDLLYEKALRKEHCYCREIVQNLLLTLFYEISALYQKKYAKSDRQLTRDEEIFRKLIRLIILHYKEERTVAFYARELCLTPKYLSSVVKKTTNRTVTEWINETVVLDAKTQLKSSQMTVQQIANYLNFPTPSFFGRFFKKHTGITPKAYRLSE